MRPQQLESYLTKVGESVLKKAEEGLTGDDLHRRPIIVEGQMGTGKSQIAMQVGKRLGFKVVDLRLALQEPGDLVGMPRVVDGKTVWSKPSWVPEPDEKLFLILDELNRAPADVQQAIFQALTEYRIHMYELPAATVIVVCINPSDDIYHVSEMDPATITRAVKLKLEVDTDQWLQYAHTKKFSDHIIQFISMHKEHLCKPTEKPPCPVPRTWEILNDMLDIIPADCTNEVITGIVGAETAVIFQKFIRENYNKPVSGKEILDGYEKVKEKLAKQRNDEMWATSRDLSALLNSIAAKGKPNEKQTKNLVGFLTDLSDLSKPAAGGPRAEWAIELIQHLPDKILSLVATNDLIENLNEILDQIKKQTKPAK